MLKDIIDEIAIKGVLAECGLVAGDNHTATSTGEGDIQFAVNEVGDRRVFCINFLEPNT